MTYHCGIGPGIPGMSPREPHLTCNGCGAMYVIKARGAPPRWLLNRRAPRGWMAYVAVGADDLLRHLCPVCRVEHG